MYQRIFLCMSALAALITAVPVTGQTAAKSGAPYVAPRRLGETPDLQGTWTSDDTWGVPFERPKQFGTRATLTEDELKAREKNVARSKSLSRQAATNHSPAKAQLDAEAKGEKPAPPPPGAIRPWSRRGSGSGALGRVRAPSIASDFADRGSAGRQASPIDSRGARPGWTRRTNCGAIRFRHPTKTGACMTAASAAAWLGPFFR